MPGSTTTQRANLRPFGSKEGLSPQEAGRRSGEARRAKRAANLVLTENTSKTLARLSTTFEREELGPNAAAMAQALIVGLASGAIPVEPRVVPELLRVLVDIARLESGQATSLAVRVGDGAVLARLEELRAQAGGEGTTRAEIAAVPPTG